MSQAVPTTYTENLVIGDVLKGEVLGELRFCRAAVTVEQDADATARLPVGQVLEASSTKEVACATGASANAVLLEPVELADLKAGDCVRAALVRGPAVVDSDNLTIAAAQKTAALAALAVLGIRTRTHT